MENYAIRVLEKDQRLLEKSLLEWPGDKYPEAKKDRIKKLSEINNAIVMLIIKA